VRPYGQKRHRALRAHGHEQDKHFGHIFPKASERQAARIEVEAELLDVLDPQLIEDSFDDDPCANPACVLCNGEGETAFDVYMAMKPLRDQAMMAVVGWTL